MLEYSQISKENFDKLIKKILVQFEGFKTAPYDDKSFHIAIGYGFDLTIHTYDSIDTTADRWKEYFDGINFIQVIDFKAILSLPITIGRKQETVHSQLKAIKEQQSNKLSNVIQVLKNNNFILKSKEDGKRLLDKMLMDGNSSYLNTLNSHLKKYDINPTDIQHTYECLALLSLCYNGGPGIIGKGLRDALTKGDRFKAWYEIRYNSNGNQLVGLAKRRMYEAHIFGLYSTREANDKVLSNSLPTKDIIVFDDVLNVFSHLNYPKFKNNKTALQYFKYYETEHKFKKDERYVATDTLLSRKEDLSKDIPFFLCIDLFQPIHEYVNYLFGNKYTDSQGKTIEAFDIDKIFVIDTTILNVNSQTMQNILNNKISDFISQKNKNTNSGNTIKSETINFLLILKGRNLSDINFGHILSENEFCSITLVLLENSAIDLSKISTENLNILFMNPQNPSEIKNISGNFQIDNDDDSIISLKNIENGLNAIYKRLEGCLSIFDELGNKLVDIINHASGTSKAAIEFPEIKYSYEVVSNKANGNFTYICYIDIVGKMQNSNEEIAGVPFYLYSMDTDEIYETTIQEQNGKLQAIFNLSIDANKISTPKIICSINKCEFDNKRKSNKYPSHTSSISKTEIQNGKKEGKYSYNKQFLVSKCEIISQTSELVKLEAEYNLNTDAEQYQEKIKNTQWCYYITDTYSNKHKISTGEAIKNILPHKGKKIEINFNELEPKYTSDKTVYFFPFMNKPSEEVCSVIVGKANQYYVNSCEVIKNADGEFHLKAIYNIKDMAIDNEVNNNTHWLIVSIESHVPTYEHSSILSRYNGMKGELIDYKVVSSDYQLEKKTGSELYFQLKDCVLWQTKSVYFLPYKKIIDKDIRALWDLSQPFYIKYTGKKLQVINRDGKVDIERSAYGGQAMEQKPESSDYKVQVVTIKKKTYYFHYDKARQSNKSSGVLPEGNYFIDIDGKNVYGFFYDMEKYFLSRIDIYRTSKLDDKKILIQEGVYRDNFYIHGGSTYLDNQGIELAKDFDKFFDELGKYNEQKQAFTVNNRTPIRLQVEYEKDGWHDPLDKMEICLFSQGGHYKPWNASFGETREAVPKNETKLAPCNHSGVDLFAPIGMPVYACLDGVYDIYGGQYGTASLIVDEDEIEILKNMYNKNYKILYNYTGNPYKYNIKNLKGELLFGSNFNINGSKFVIRYQHLSSFESNLHGKQVKRGTIIGRTGVTGAGANNCGPHLHFEIGHSANIGLDYKANPAAFVNIKFPEKVFPKDILDQLKGGKSNDDLMKNINYLKSIYPYFKEQVEYLLKISRRNDLLLKITGGSV